MGYDKNKKQTYQVYDVFHNFHMEVKPRDGEGCGMPTSSTSRNSVLVIHTLLFSTQVSGLIAPLKTEVASELQYLPRIRIVSLTPMTCIDMARPATKMFIHTCTLYLGSAPTSQSICDLLQSAVILLHISC